MQQNMEKNTEKETNSTIKEISSLYEENQLLKKELSRISKLDFILRTLEVGGWDKDLEEALRYEVKLAFMGAPIKEEEHKEEEDK